MKAEETILLRGLFQGILPEDRGPFVPLFEGVDILRLHGPKSTDPKAVAEQPSAALIRYQPGARVPRHRHVGHEYIVVLSGSQTDERGTYEQGTCVINPPGTSHAVRSDDGCLVLVIWDHPVDVLTEENPALVQ